jgi:hypothetical protein
MAKQRITEGAILEIQIENKYYYAQILLGGLGYVFFDFQGQEKLKDFEILKGTSVLFILTVYNDVVTSGRWLKAGKMEIREDLKIQPMKFIQDPIDFNRFELYNPSTGEISKATKQECEGLECASVWAANHVEDRIRDYYLGVQNIWYEQTKIKEFGT